jgi:ribosome-associated toxin RatA of RatAB toxin-antitoxin module
MDTMSSDRMLQALSSAARFLLGIGLGWAGMAAAADPVTVNFQQQGTRLMASGELAVPVSAATAWEVLTDYGRVPEFVPGMRISRVIEQNGDISMVEQQGEMMANNLRMFYQGVLKIVRESPDRLSVQFVSGTFRNMQGQWTVSGKNSQVKLGYQLELETGTPYPSPIMVAMLQQQVTLWVSSLAAEMERRPPPKPEPKPEPKSKPRGKRK